MKKNGSGKYSISVSMERFLKEVGDYAIDHPESVSEDEDENDNNFDDFIDILDEKRKQLENTHGISHVWTRFDTVKYVVSIGFDYENISALNGGLAAAQLFTTIDNNSLPDGFQYFQWEDNKLIRHEDPNFKKSFQLPQSKISDQAALKGMDMAMFLQDVSYATHYTFETPIKSYNHEEIVIAKGNTEVLQKIYPFKRLQSIENSLEGVFEFNSIKKKK
jgi:hypothetical protein